MNDKVISLCYWAILEKVHTNSNAIDNYTFQGYPARMVFSPYCGGTVRVPADKAKQFCEDNRDVVFIEHLREYNIT